MDNTPCPFCDPSMETESCGSNELVLSRLDKYPVSEGHTLIVPRVHEPDFLKLDAETQAAMMAMAAEIANRRLKEPGVTGCNIGLNIGRSAGQTVDHAHLHVIPRRDGDVDDPRGGVRWVIPGNADYWSRGDG